MAHGGGHTNQASVYPDQPSNQPIRPSVTSQLDSLSPFFVSSRLALRLICLIRQRPSFLPSFLTPSPSAPAGALPTTVVRRAPPPQDGNSLRSGLKRGRADAADGHRGPTRASGRGARATDARPATAWRRYKIVTGAIFQIRSITFIMRRGESIRGNGDEKYRAETLADSQTVAAEDDAS